mmetsp:Transcript_116028/g.374797  ORF Transcript_116028/g.374797 Transcript_116028/m.374797 type:complete len:228 (-) Transcript_116028:229-912(-)
MTRDHAEAAAVEVAQAKLRDVVIGRRTLERAEDQMHAAGVAVEAAMRRRVSHGDPEIRAPARAIEGASIRVEGVPAFCKGVELAAEPIRDVSAEGPDHDAEAAPSFVQGLDELEESWDDVAPWLRCREAPRVKHCMESLSQLPVRQAQGSFQALAHRPHAGDCVPLLPQRSEQAALFLEAAMLLTNPLQVRDFAGAHWGGGRRLTVPDPTIDIVYGAMRCSAKRFVE